MDKQRLRGCIKSTAILIAGAIIYSIGTQCLISPANIAPGGAVGIALMFSYLTNLPVGGLTLMVNIPLLLLAWFFLSHRFAIRTGITCIICSVFIDLIVAPYFPLYGGDRLISSLYGGIVIGVGMALIFLAGSTTGGSDIAGYLLRKKWPHISIGRFLMMIDGIILSSSVLVFHDIDAALLGLICLYAETKVIDMILYLTSASCKVMIVTQHPQEICTQIILNIERSATIISGKGAYSGDDTNVVICTVRKSEFSDLKKIIEAADENAFVMVTETNQVFGLGFRNFSEVIS